MHPCYQGAHLLFVVSTGALSIRYLGLIGMECSLEHPAFGGADSRMGE